MTDINSSLPVRTENPGDVVVKLGDATTPSQQQAVNDAGSAQIDGQGVAGTPAGGVVSVQGVVGGTALPVSGTLSIVDPAEGPVGSPPPADAIYIGGLVGTSSPSWSNGNMESISLTLAGAVRVDGSAVTQPISAASLPLPTGAATNAELITINSTLGSPFQAGGSIGNTTFASTQSGTWNINNISGTISLPTGASTSALQTSGNASLTTIAGALYAQGSTTSGEIGPLMLGAVTTSAPSYTSGQSDPLSLTTAGALRVDGSAVTQPVSGTVTANQGGAPWSQNITQVLGAAPSATNGLAVQIATAGAYVSSSNPLPVIIDPAAAGTPVVDYKTAAPAAGASDNHDYTVTSGKTLHLMSIESSASGKAEMMLQIETGVATGVFTTKSVQFNSTATPNMTFPLPAPLLVAAGVRVRVVMTNRENQADSVYSTINGFEI
jgi:hypothetical protein